MTKKIKAPILVTGATGFIGQVLIKKLREKKLRVRALVLPDDSIPAKWGDDVEIVRGDITRYKEVKIAMEGIKTVFHLAAVVTDWGDEKRFWEIGVQGTQHVLHEASENKIRMILASSIVVYGDKIGKQVCDENTPFGKTFGPYSYVKQAQEKLAQVYVNKKDLQLTVIRPANVYGPCSHPWVHQVLETLKSGSPTLVNGGNFNAGLVYVDSVAEAMILCAASEIAIGKTYNVCDDNQITWKQYFRDLAIIAGYPSPKPLPKFLAKTFAHSINRTWRTLKLKTQPPITLESLNLVGSNHQINTNRLKEDLGFAPNYSYAKALEETRQYIQKHII